jgi:hypothetical protein
MNDQELMTAVRQSFDGVRMDVPAEQIVSRSRTIRASGHRRFAVGVTAVVAAGSAALGLGLSGALGAASTGAAGAIHGAGANRNSTIHGAGTIRTEAFTLTSNANGTDTLTLTMNQMLDPAALQQALAQDGVRALVKTGVFCWSSPAAPDPTSIGVLTVRLPVKPAAHPVMVKAPPGPAPTALKQLAARTATVINPAAIPSGTELFFGYSTSIHAVFTDLIYTGSYACGNALPASASVRP